MARDTVSKPVWSIPVPRRVLIHVLIRVLIIVVMFCVVLACLFQNSLRKNLPQRVTWEQFARDYEAKRGYKPPPLLRHWLAFALKHACPLDQYETIYSDLARFRAAGLSEANVQEALASCPTCKLVKLEDGQLSIGQPGQGSSTSISWILRPAVATPGLRFSMVVNFDDRPQVLLAEDTSNKLPIMSWSVRKDGRNGDIRFPYDQGVFMWKPEEAIMWGMRDWKERIPAVVWRGTTTGTFIGSGANWRHTPRFQMVGKYGHPGTVIAGLPVDIGFIRILQCVDEDECDLASKEFAFGMRWRVPFEWFAYHQYVIDIDGNAFSARFAPLLRSGTVIFKAGEFLQWFHERIAPWRHYIPVDISLDDLEEKVVWAVQNPDRCARIANDAAEIAAKVLRDVDFRCYAYRLAIEYAALFNPRPS